MQCKYRVVVSIDGGGIRGVLPLRLIDFIQKEISCFDPAINPSSWVDLYAATSTGTIISGALMIKNEIGQNKYSPNDIMNLYLKRGEQIFAHNPQKLNSKNKYPLHFVLDYFFGSTTLDQLDKRFLFFSYDLNADEPFYFHDGMEHLRSMTVANMMTACSAFPGIFPPMKIGYKLLADGILASKNPAIMAYKYAKMNYPDDPIVLISLGVGEDQTTTFNLFDAESNRTHNEMENISKEDSKLIYFRFQPEIQEASNDLNDSSAKNSRALLNDADRFILENSNKFDRLFSLMKIKMEYL